MKHRPIIGITPGLSDDERRVTTPRSKMDVLLGCGAVPVLLPLTSDEEALRTALSAVDGVMFSGGGDLNPLLFGELQRPGCGAISPLRDEMELTLCRLLLEDGHKPVLGICRGLQVMNVALGGDIYQDLTADFRGTPFLHRQQQPSRYPSHPVTLTPDSPLRSITGEERLLVNSLHHQAIRRLGKGFVSCAEAPDGVIEAAWLPEHPFFLGIQWHPECLWTEDCASKAIFLAFVSACGE